MGRLYLGTQEIGLYEKEKSLVEYSLDENGKISKSDVDFKLPSNIKDLDSYVFYYALYKSPDLTSVDLSSLTTISGYCGAGYAFSSCPKLTSVDLSSLTTISGDYGADDMFRGCSSLVSVDLSSLTTISGTSGASNMFRECTKLVSVDLSSLTTISGTFGANYMFQNCSKLTSVDLSSLTTFNGPSGASGMFSGCTSLKELRFPALTADSFGSANSQFSSMLSKVTGCTVHFPASTQAKIETMSGYPNFGGTNTTVLFDL